MKSFIYLIAGLFLAMTVLPAVITKTSELPQETAESSEKEETTLISEEKSNTIAVFKTAEEKTEEIDFFEYVCGSVAAEMPLSYHEEALKAQAVACYTNALRLKNGEGYKNGSHISDDSALHQGYLNRNQRKAKWGEDFEKYEAKLQSVVKEVEGEALYYKDELCVAAFFALSSGTTESAENIWGESVEYLKSVKSEGDILSPKQTTILTVNKNEFLEKSEALGIKTQSIDSLKNIIKITKTSKTGTVLEAKINGKKVSGEEIRKAFSLRSAVFTVKCTEKKVVFTVRGYGHGVGLSQYGADFSARQGSTYEEILKHYYKGVEIKKL